MSTSDWQLASEHSGCLIRVQTLLRRLQGFHFLLLQHNNPQYRDGLIESLRTAHSDSRIFDLRRISGFSEFEAWLEEHQQVPLLHLLNLESLSSDQQREFFKGINYHREHIARTFSGILVFWLPEPLIRDMALQAPDFWAWREQVLDFSLPVEPPERVASSRIYTVNMDSPKKQKRIQEIEEFLDSLPEQQPTLTVADMQRELGGLYWSVGEYAKARKILEAVIAEYGQLDEAHARAVVRGDLADLLVKQGEPEQALRLLKEQVLPVYQHLNKEREQAVTIGRIADILQARGQLDEALEIYEQEILPIFERLGDVRLKAVTMGKIADIFQARGQLDEALKIREKEELPVYERLSDVREKAVTMGKIADILQARGQLDEALKIRKTEQLPVYERLGDVREKAVTMGRIADMLQVRGQLDEALRIREKEELPVYERLGDVRELLIGRTNLSLLLRKMDAEANKNRIKELLRLALADARRLQLPEAKQIEGIMKDMRIALQ